MGCYLACLYAALEASTAVASGTRPARHGVGSGCTRGIVPGGGGGVVLTLGVSLPVVGLLNSLAPGTPTVWWTDFDATPEDLDLTCDATDLAEDFSS
ncbi:hypothetical protein XF35_19725 [Streptomyces platensis subsp. clarensis]|nr:hypothetical protein [Streptomyces platensis subsp. clarensis]